MKKTFSAILAAMLLAGNAVPAFADAALPVFEKPAAVEEDVEEAVSAPDKETPTEPTAEDMEKMIKIVKPKLNVPEDCTAFSWYYNAPSYYSRGTWSFEWHDKNYTKVFNVACDDKGRVISYSSYDWTGGTAEGDALPKFTRDELAGVAEAELNRVCPDAAKSLKLVASTSAGRYSHTFCYAFERYENGVIVPDNGASVYVDYVTGKVTEFNVDYNYEVKFTDTAKVGEDEAKKILSGEQNMTLSYRLKTEYDDDWNVIGRKAYLVYTPDIGYLSVDAKEGTVYTERSTWNVQTEAPRAANTAYKYADMAEAETEEAAADDGYVLSEEELAGVEQLNNLITKDEAIKAVTSNKYLYLEADATAIEANLSVKYDNHIYRGKDAEAKKEYQWDLYFEAPYTKSTEETGYYYAYMNATVDAQTGKIISFRSSVPGYRYYRNDVRTLDLPELTVDKDTAAANFEAFAKEQVPELFSLTRRTNAGEGNVIGYANEKNFEYPIYRTASFNYIRVNEGIDFTQNSLRASVDRVTGKIVSFNYNWYDDVVFESPKNIITPEEAYAVILNADGFGPNYEINSNYTYKKYLADEAEGYIDYNKLYETEQYTRLVYSVYDAGSTTVSALTGKLLNYDGEEYKPLAETAYTDIEGHWAQEYINTLTDLDITFEGDKFMPDAFITPEDFRYLMNAFGRYTGEEIDEEADTITRTDAVRNLVSSAGYAKIAAMTNIFITDFADNSSLKTEDVGCIAIARGFGLIQGDIDGFRPYDKLTRAEAACLMINFVGCKF